MDLDVVGRKAVKPTHRFGCDHSPLLHLVERFGIGEEQVEGDRERPGVLAAHRHEDVAHGSRGHQPTSSSSMRKASRGSSTSMTWCALNRKTSPLSNTAFENGQATVAPPRHPGLFACMNAYQMTLVAVSVVCGSGPVTSMTKNAS